MARLGRSYPAQRLVKAKKISAGGSVSVFGTESLDLIDDAHVDPANTPGADTLALTDAATLRNLSAETLSFAEGQTLALPVTGDTITLVDTAVVKILPTADTLAFVEGTAQIASSLFGTETLTLADNAQVTVAASETLSLADTGEALVGIEKSAADTFSLADLAGLASSVTTSDALAFTESAYIIVQPNPEARFIVDNAAPNIGVDKAASDTFTLADTSSLQAVQFGSDTFAFDEDDVAVGVRPSTEALALADTGSANVGVPKVVTESLTYVESANLLTNGMGLEMMSFADTAKVVVKAAEEFVLGEYVMLLANGEPVHPRVHTVRGTKREFEVPARSRVTEVPGQKREYVVSGTR